MIIRKAKKSDLGEYSNLVKESNKEYSRLINSEANFTDKEIKKDFEEIQKSSKKILLIAEKEEKIVGYLAGTTQSINQNKTGHIDFLFVSKKYRKNGIAHSLIKEFSKILIKKRIKKYKLKVSPKNKNAINFYKKLGFKIGYYEMIKKLK